MFVNLSPVIAVIKNSGGHLMHLNTVNPDEQMKRIQQRSGDVKAMRFKNLWIPMEEKYFEAFDIEAQCDFVIDTSEIW